MRVRLRMSSSLPFVLSCSLPFRLPSDQGVFVYLGKSESDRYEDEGSV